MIEEMASDFFRIEIPLPDTMLKFVNSYIIKDSDRHLVIDTGMYDDECLEAMMTYLRELAVDLNDTDFFITHCHGDHIGLVSRLISNGSSVYIHKAETELVKKIQNGLLFSEIKIFLDMSGFPEKDPFKILPHRVKDEFKSRSELPFKFVKDGDVVKKAQYRFRCIETPGHNKGHVCLYEPDTRFLIAGDHLLGDITPGIQGRIDGENPLKDYLSSLRKIYSVDVGIVLPGHRLPFSNYRERINEIEAHHRQRNNELIRVLEKGGRTIYEIASKMTWNVDCDSWDSFPVVQSFFATGETFAHLRYLEEEDIVRRDMRGNTLVYRLNN